MGSAHKISDEILNRILLKIHTSELDQKTLAKKIGISPTTITDWKTGKSRSYNRPQMLALLAKELGTTAEYLLTGKENEDPPFPIVGGKINELLNLFADLNEPGQDKVLEYIDDLKKSGKHSKR